MNSGNHDSEQLNAAIRDYYEVVAGVYRVGWIVFPLIAVGATLALAVAYGAVVRGLSMEPGVLASLVFLSALLVLSGVLLYALIAKLRCRICIASADIQLRVVDHAARGRTVDTGGK